MESDSLSLLLATLRLTDCLGLATMRTLEQEAAQGIVRLTARPFRTSDTRALKLFQWLSRRGVGPAQRNHACITP